MKLYEGMIKRRLVQKLEDENLLSTAQAAYGRSMSTADHIFVLQELIFGWVRISSLKIPPSEPYNIAVNFPLFFSIKYSKFGILPYYINI